MSDARVDSLSKFVDEIDGIRRTWRIPEHEELWFRGEVKKYDTRLRPVLFRPKDNLPLRPVSELLEIESDLYEQFQRCAVQLCNEKSSDEEWPWNSYFLMQHHGAPTRLLDWSDGALMALHFAVRKISPEDDRSDGVVYVLEPSRLREEIYSQPENEVTKENWEKYVAANPSDDMSPENWEDSYLPSDGEDLEELPMPRLPLLLKFDHITRRVAAQRSRFMVFGTDPTWFAEKFSNSADYIRCVKIDSGSRYKIRNQLRDCGITESVIYPDLDGLGRELSQLWDDRK